MARYLAQLGLESRAKPVPSLDDYLRQRGPRTGEELPGPSPPGAAGSWGKTDLHETGVNPKRKGTAVHRSIRLDAGGHACTRVAASLGVWEVLGVRLSDAREVSWRPRREPRRCAPVRARAP